MKTRSYRRDIRAAALRDELLAAGVPVLAVRPPAGDESRAIIDLDDAADAATVDAVVAAHNAAALDAATTADKQQFANDVAAVQAFRQLASGTATDTQRDSAIKALSRLVQRAVRELRDA